MPEQGNRRDLTVDSVAVRAEGLFKSFSRGTRRVQALSGVSVDFRRGEWTAVMGPSGSGKTTLIHCLAGLDTVDAGSVTVGTTDLTGLREANRTRLRRSEIGFVFQSFNLVPVLNVRENILLCDKLARHRSSRGRFDRLVDELEIGALLKRRPHELSGGEQQRVAIARALLPSPKVVFADEPTGNLDSDTGSSVLTLLRRSTSEHGHTVVMVTHDAEAASRTDRVVILRDGRLTADIAHPDLDSVQTELRTHT